MSVDFDYIEQRLKAGGVAGKYIKRTLCELKDHHADLVSEYTAGETPRKEAEQMAWQSIGNQDVILQAVLSKPELKPWSGRWPQLFYGLGPSLALSALSFSGYRSCPGLLWRCLGQLPVIPGGNNRDCHLHAADNHSNHRG